MASGAVHLWIGAREFQGRSKCKDSTMTSAKITNAVIVHWLLRKLGKRLDHICNRFAFRIENNVKMLPHERKLWSRTVVS